MKPNPEQLPLPFIAEPPNIAEQDKRKAIAVERKPPEREGAVVHPAGEVRSA